MNNIVASSNIELPITRFRIYFKRRLSDGRIVYSNRLEVKRAPNDLYIRKSYVNALDQEDPTFRVLKHLNLKNLSDIHGEHILREYTDGVLAHDFRISEDEFKTIMHVRQGSEHDIIVDVPDQAIISFSITNKPEENKGSLVFSRNLEPFITTRITLK